MGKTVWKGGALLAPLPPVMVSCGTVEKPNIITIAWTGILNTKPAKTYIAVRPSRYSYNIIKESGEFVINLTTKDLVYAADFCGVRSGAQVDKFQHCKLTPIAASQVQAPMIKECPLSLECRVLSVDKAGDTHDVFFAEVVAVQVDDTLLDRDGKLHLDRAGLAAFAHGEYYEVGKKIGTFGFSVRKNKKRNPPKSAPKDGATKKQPKRK